MAYFVADEKLQGYYVSGGVTINIVKYNFECDDAASLPAQTAFIASKKVKISMASTAHTIDTDALYKMSSSGAWIQQSQPWKPLADYSVLSNKPNINGHTLTGNQSGDDLGLQNTLTFEAVPTQNSTNPVTSGGIWTDQQRQETEIGVVANAGAKNAFDIDRGVLSAISYHASHSLSGDTLTVASSGNWSRVAIPYEYEKGTSIFSCTVSNFVKEGGTVVIRFAENADSTRPLSDGITITGNGDVSKEITLASDTSGYIVYYINAVGTSYNNSADFSKNMMRPAAITDATFQPFAKTNRELTILTDEDRSALVELVDGGAKNLLKNELGSGTKSGIEYTTGTDGSIVITAGTARGGNADFVIPFTPTKTGQYVLQGCPDGGSSTTYKVQIALYPSMSNVVEIYENTNATATLTGGTQYAYRFRVYNGKAIGDVTIYPMVCSLAAWKISNVYKPYCPSMQELYQMILALQ